MVEKDNNPINTPETMEKVRKVLLDVLDLEPEKPNASYLTAKINACLALLRVEGMDKGQAQGTLDELIQLARRSYKKDNICKVDSPAKPNRYVRKGKNTGLSTVVNTGSEPSKGEGSPGGGGGVRPSHSSLRLTKTENGIELVDLVGKSVGGVLREMRVEKGVEGFSEIKGVALV